MRTHRDDLPPNRRRRGFVGRIRGWRQRLRERSELARLSDRDLRDLGITRIDAEAQARIPFWRI
ncbi:MAG: DUF1127 domain-containing protein [Stellaceae bacterium]